MLHLALVLPEFLNLFPLALFMPPIDLADERSLAGSIDY